MLLQMNIMSNTAGVPEEPNMAIFTSILLFLFQGEILIAFVVTLCIHPTSFLFCFGPSPATVKVNSVCMECFRDGPGSTGILCLKKLSKIAY